MHQFVQSAIEAAKQGDNNKALAFLNQVLNANPNDIDAWLVLAAVVDDPQRKRQCLKRALTLDPSNQVAREELLEMDRAEMGGESFQHEPALVSTPLYQSEETTASYSTGTSAFEPESLEQDIPPVPVEPQEQPAPPAKAPARKAKEKTLVFKYPLFWRILVYFLVVLFGFGGLVVATQNLLTGTFFLGLGLIMLVTAFALSPTVEVSAKGIRASGMFSTAGVGWSEIARMKSNSMKRRLELTKHNGEVVNVSTQVSGYPRIVEILKKKRPDLFGTEQKPQMQTSAFSSSFDDRSTAGSGGPGPAPAFKGTKTFRKSFLKQYGSYLIVIPFCLIAAWTVYAEPQYRVGAGLSVIFCLVMIVLPLFQVSTVRVEPDRLTIQTMFEEKVFSAKEISGIKMQTVRGRYGRATNSVNILPVKGKNYPLQGFSEGDEIIYGILTDWWNAHRNG